MEKGDLIKLTKNYEKVKESWIREGYAIWSLFGIDQQINELEKEAVKAHIE
jgi:hypothetical protein